MPIVVIGALLTVLWALTTTGSLLAPFVLAFVLAYVLDPLVDKLEVRGVARWLAIVLLTLPVVGLAAAFVLLVVPAVVAHLGEVIKDLPLLFQRLADFAEGIQQRLLVIDVPFIDEGALIERLRSVDESAVALIQERQQDLGEWVWSGFLGLGRGLGAMATVAGYVVLTPVLTFYLLRDWDVITGRLADLLPRPSRPEVLSFTSEFDRLLSRYLRGQITVAVVVGTITGIGLWIAQFPYAGTLGLIVAVFSVVPYLGLLLSLVPALVIAIVSGSVGVSLLKVAVVYGVAQGLEGAVISPRIVGESVGLHPVWVVLALALGGFLFGFVGLLIAVPAAVCVKLLIQRALVRYRASDVYTGRASAPAD